MRKHSSGWLTDQVMQPLFIPDYRIRYKYNLIVRHLIALKHFCCHPFYIPATEHLYTVETDGIHKEHLAPISNYSVNIEKESARKGECKVTPSKQV